LDAVALRETHDDGHIVGMAVGFQDAVHGVDSVDFKLVCVGCFPQGLAQLRVYDVECLVDALSLDAEAATYLGL